MSTPTPQDEGPGRYLVRERMFAIGDDYWVTRENGEKAFWVDGKALRLRDTLEIRHPDGLVLATVRKKVVTWHHEMTVQDATGATVATVRRHRFAPLHERFGVELDDGQEWEASGDILDKEFGITGPDGPVAHISRRWFRLRDTYGIDIAPGQDHALVIAVAVCIDRLSEEHEHHDGDH